MAQIGTPDEVLRIFSACEAAYADASQKGYADSPNVIAAIADLKSAYKALVIANGNLTASKRPFDKTVATLRARRACRVFREACVELDIAIEQAAAEHRLYNRCLMLSQPAQPGPGRREVA
jgi:hypothetical protein